MDSLRAAVNSGCDAVYLGGKKFGARAYAGNFDLQELEDACDYCHLRGVKVYVTVNTVYKDEELKEFLAYMKELYEMGVDALIMQDAGAAKLVKEHFPDFPLHASTQMTCNSLADVKYWESQGFSKIVLSRELSVEEIRYITENVDAEIETFVHGALCVCYSGQCIMSSILGGRSGNRGRCAQTCRLPYTLYRGTENMEEGYLLSPKDIMTVNILPELIEAGIASLKIEGRMKSPEYVAGVTGIYRKYIDLYFEDPENYEVDKEDIKALNQLFNRGGFTEGYYTSFAGRDMMSIERPKPWGLKVGIVDKYLPKHNKVTIRTREPLVPGDGLEVWTQEEPHVGTNVSKHSKAGEVITITMEGNINKNDVVYRTFGKALNDELKKSYERDTRKMPISGMLRVKEGEPISLQLWDNGGNSVFVSGAVVEPAGSSPMLPMKLRELVNKMGATPFVLENLQTDIDQYIFVSVAEVNRVRREACEALEASIIKKSKRKAKSDAVYAKPEKRPFQLRKKLTALVMNLGQLDAVLNAKGFVRVYYECSAELEKNLDKIIERCRNKGVQLYIALPRVAREWNAEKEQPMIDMLIGSEIDGFLVRSAGQFDQVKDSGKKIVVDYNLNTMNRQTVEYWKEQGADNVCLSVEANLQEINQMGDRECEMLVYGYLPLMKTQQCPIGNYVGGKDGHKFCSERNNEDLYFLRDRKGVKFPLMTDCERCVCTILNGKPLFTLKFYDEILESTTGYVRLDFTKEGPGRTEKIARAYGEMTADVERISPATRNLL
ncbi:MAG: U32 family peptidase, partial [Anaerotignum sp.]|nr:U32 family peptidase [Anaerotignum sp.]